MTEQAILDVLRILGFATRDQLAAHLEELARARNALVHSPGFAENLRHVQDLLTSIKSQQLPDLDSYSRDLLQQSQAISNMAVSATQKLLIDSNVALGWGLIPASGVFQEQLRDVAEQHRQLMGNIRNVPSEFRRVVGERINVVKESLDDAQKAVEAELLRARNHVEHSDPHFDPTLPARPLAHGSLHPLTRVVRRLEEIFTSMGYAILDGPEVELDYYNFEALNIPKDHPAREMHDTFWCDREQKLLMRTHTSPVQARSLERMKPPFRAIVPGRCFRNETTDASHEHTFHQMEGLVVGEGITVGHLIGTMKTFLREVFEKDLEVRLRPGYFPFVEPGFELDVRCPFCTGGCSVCKRSTWIELCPCGMVHPKVLRYGGVDPERYTGFAFGLGLSRLVMLRYGIDDIRHLMGADLRFLEQF